MFGVKKSDQSYHKTNRFFALKPVISIVSQPYSLVPSIYYLVSSATTWLITLPSALPFNSGITAFMI